MATLIVVGLGNPGERFDGTRHNIGASALEVFARRNGTPLGHDKKTKARVGTVSFGSKRVVAAVPMTYMNDSGEAVVRLVRYHLHDEESRLSNCVVIHDELDLDPGVVRLKFGGGTAGHNGLRSIGNHLHGLDFYRIRIGVGKPPPGVTGADYVLSRPPKAERETFDLACERAADALECAISEGFDRAMSSFNAR